MTPVRTQRGLAESLFLSEMRQQQRFNRLDKATQTLLLVWKMLLSIKQNGSRVMLPTQDWQLKNAKCRRCAGGRPSFETFEMANKKTSSQASKLR